MRNTQRATIMVNSSTNFPLPSMIMVPVLSHSGHYKHSASAMVNRSHRLQFNQHTRGWISHYLTGASIPECRSLLRPRDRRNASGLLHKLFGEIFGEKKGATAKMEDDRWEVFPLENYCYNQSPHTRGTTIGAIINTRHPCFVFLLHFLDMKPYFIYFTTLTPNNMKHSLILPNN